MVRRVRVQDLFDGPAEATRPVFVDGFEHQEERADLEDGGTDESGYSSCSCGFIFEF